MSSTAPANGHGITSCYLLGYSGKRNTGADARLVCIIGQLREALGNDVRMTVSTMDVTATKKVLAGISNIQFAALSPVFPFTVGWQAARHDLTVLVEGSTFKQNWSRTLLYVFLFGAWCARLFGRRCIAYAVDAGRLSAWNARLTRHVCESVDVLMTRTETARESLSGIGVQNPVWTGTDPAFEFETRNDVPAVSLSGGRPVVGLAPVECYQWPVRVRLFGPAEECYHWPHYFTWNDERRAHSREAIDAWRRFIRHVLNQHDMDIALIAMEALDQQVCERILEHMGSSARSRIRLISSREYAPVELVPVLRNLDYLVTSRYHACVLSMQGSVPQLAISHDERLASIYHELGLKRYLLNCEQGRNAEVLIAAFDRLVDENAAIRAAIEERHETYFLPRCRSNVDFVRLAAQTWTTSSPPVAATGVNPASTQGVEDIST